MSKKDSNFFEEHVEKIVLALVVIVCIVLSYLFVVKSPCTVNYDGQKIGPGDIDNYILNEQAEVLESRLDRSPEQPEQPYKTRVGDFTALLNSAIGNIDGNIYPPLPFSLESVIDDRVYRIPVIGEVSEVSVEHIRAVAYVPNGEINEENVYSEGNSEPNDIDLVTVEAKFDVSELYSRFYESFAGGSVQQDWRDPCLAKPVFAAVQLQRQRLLPDGSWSDWRSVPRSKVDDRRKMFEIIEDINNLPAGGVKVRLLQFDDAEVRTDLLQPEAYQIASAREEWFPPSLHREYVDYQREMNIMERREAVAEKREEREGERLERRRTTTVKTRPTEVRMEGDRGPTTSAVPGRTSPRRNQPARDSEKERTQKSKGVSRTIDDIYMEFSEISIADRKNIAHMSEPLLFWANDDTVEPGKSYRYRIRLGIFNPIAGTSQFSKRDLPLKNRVILWSEFSDTTEIVDVPGTLYFFPRDIQEATNTVIVQVSRYVLGYWYSRDFTVRQGELIGKLGEYRITKEEEQEKVSVPKIVDYTTGAVLVDVVPVSDWSGGNILHFRHFFEMLYSFSGKNIERLPVKNRYWDEVLQSKFNEIKRAEREPKEPLRRWAGQQERRRTSKPTFEGDREGMGL